MKRLVIGIPTLRRRRDYLEPLLERLFAEIPESELGDVEVTILNVEAQPENHLALSRALRAHQHLVRSGVLRVEVGDPPGHIPARPDQAWLRWRSKQAHDVATLMSRCVGRGEYYLHLEDDMLPGAGFLEKLWASVSPDFARRHDWLALCLYHDTDQANGTERAAELFGGAGALLFRTADLPALTAFIRQHWLEAPIDYLIGRHAIATGLSLIVITPCIFQHVGVVSSLETKVQVLGATRFEEPYLARLRRDVVELVALARIEPRAIPRFLRYRLLGPLWRSLPHRLREQVRRNRCYRAD